MKELESNKLSQKVFEKAFKNLSGMISGMSQAFRNGTKDVASFTSGFDIIVGNLFPKTYTGIATLKAGFKGLWGIIKAHPLISAIAAIAAVVSIVAALTDSLDELEEKLSETQGELAEIQTELTSLEDELTTISDKIAEINSQDNLSITDEKELQKLQQESAEIQRQIDLLKLKESIKQGEVYDTFIISKK